MSFAGLWLESIDNDRQKAGMVGQMSRLPAFLWRLLSSPARPMS